jgi:rod shape-determining protein MreC
MAFAGGGMNTPSARDSAPGGRFIFFALLSLVLMYFDQRDGWGAKVRYVLQAVAYPIQVTVGSPGRLISATSEMLRTRASLREENQALQARDRELELRTQRFEALERENEQLRGLAAGSLPPLVTKSELVDVIKAELGLQRQRLVINKGDSEGLFRSQSVVDGKGLVGQLVRVGPWSAEVMLISDPAASVYVEIVRNGITTVAEGTGDPASLLLPQLPTTADVKEGDLIVTSGLGGVFPAGIPVGEVFEIERDPDELLATVRVRPRANLDRSHRLLALWFDATNPAAPWQPVMLDSLPPASIADPVTREAPASRPAGASAEPARRKPATQAGPHPPAARPAEPAPEKPAQAPEAAEPVQ